MFGKMVIFPPTIFSEIPDSEGTQFFKEANGPYFESFIFLPSLSHEKVGQRRSCIFELWDLCDT